jgi:hypothetical protein
MELKPVEFNHKEESVLNACGISKDVYAKVLEEMVYCIRESNTASEGIEKILKDYEIPAVPVVVIGLVILVREQMNIMKKFALKELVKGLVSDEKE